MKVDLIYAHGFLVRYKMSARTQNQFRIAQRYEELYLAEQIRQEEEIKDERNREMNKHLHWTLIAIFVLGLIILTLLLIYVN